MQSEPDDVTVTITVDGVEIGRVRITKQYVHTDETADYLAEFAIERNGAVGLHSRAIRRFEYKKYNALALLFGALARLTAKDLELEPDDGSAEGGPADMARQVRGLGPAPLREEEEHPVRHHRPPFWRR